MREKTKQKEAVQGPGGEAREGKDKVVCAEVEDQKKREDGGEDPESRDTGVVRSSVPLCTDLHCVCVRCW